VYARIDERRRADSLSGGAPSHFFHFAQVASAVFAKRTLVAPHAIGSITTFRTVPHDHRIRFTVIRPGWRA
jgi:hypothetical protein